MGCLISIAMIFLFAIGLSILKAVLLYGLGSIDFGTYIIEFAIGFLVFHWVWTKTNQANAVKNVSVDVKK